MKHERSPKSLLKSRKESISARKKNEDFNPSFFITSRFTEADIVGIKEAFDSYDSNCTGILTPNDLKLALFHQNFHATKDTVYSIIAEYDEECMGGLNFEAFMKVISTEPTEKESIHELKKCFRKYDLNNKGYIDFHDIKHLAISAGENCTDREIDEIFIKIDPKNIGKITFEEFSKLMHHPDSYY